MRFTLFVLVLVCLCLVSFVSARGVEEVVGGMFNQSVVVERGWELQGQRDNLDIGNGAFYYRLGLAGFVQVWFVWLIPFLLSVGGFLFYGYVAGIVEQDFGKAVYYWLGLGVIVFMNVLSAFLLPLLMVVL